MTTLDLSKEFETPNAKCPHCGKLNDCSSGPEQPTSGDVTICIGCAEISVFEDDLRLRKPTPEEKALIDGDYRLYILRMGILHVNAEAEGRLDDSSKAVQ